MESIFETSTYEAEIQQIVADVFHAMLLCHTEPAPPWNDGQAGSVTAAVFFAGMWQGAVLLECGSVDSLAFASRLMKIAPGEATDEDARDAVGELVNMIGGNLKSVLPRGVELSLPFVVKGADYACNICGCNRRQVFTFRSNLGSLRVTLVQTDSNLTPSNHRATLGP